MKVIFKPTGDEFAISADEDILTAALRHGINLQYGCRHGNCSSCKHWLLEGDVDDSAASVYAIPRDEREDGAILLCCSYPRTDLLIEIDQHEGSEELPPMEPPARRVATVTGVRPLTKSLVELRVRLDRTLSFRAGQYAEFLIPGTSERRSFSLASAPSEELDCLFCIKRVDGGAFGTLLQTLRPGDSLDIEAPFGAMFYRDTGRPVLIVATGSGIAPIMSILNDIAGAEVPIRFYYGIRCADDLIYQDALNGLAERFSDFEFIPCVSRGSGEGINGARLGRVNRVIAEDIRDASAYDAYLCGPPAMCDAVRLLLEVKGLPDRRIHADRFFPAIAPERR
ncbi:2Fe-2S iron-sulfur cluster-binding protein [Mycolicibacterium hippocampi]|uniref:Methane monooxygenase component C n=1 Tax=Mycolicibacterium hippocampi TaxID=659824 RepID=A0A7I9ZM57_9MYCO|nr:2Fe-2S iron-sulfur cluster-binding protein [Mycolicibacterium hippocampi]GFH02110.1 methane monooxygenase component C [Mycolicibacterium hippocampi]